MKLKRKEFWVFVAPLLILALAFPVGGLNNYLIRQEEEAQLKPIMREDGSVAVSRQRQRDGSIKLFLHHSENDIEFLGVEPGSSINKPKGLFQTRYLVFGVALALALSLLSLSLLVISAFLRRRWDRAR